MMGKTQERCHLILKKEEPNHNPKKSIDINLKRRGT